VGAHDSDHVTRGLAANRSCRAFQEQRHPRRGMSEARDSWALKALQGKTRFPRNCTIPGWRSGPGAPDIGGCERGGIARWRSQYVDSDLRPMDCRSEVNQSVVFAGVSTTQDSDFQKPICGRFR